MIDSCNRRKFITNGSLAVAGILAGSSLARGLDSGSQTSIQSKLIPTLKGKVESQKLGITLMHEHILIGNIPENLRKQTVDIAVGMLNDAAKAGLTTLVDVMPFDSYNNCLSCNTSSDREYEVKLELYQAIAAQTSVNIVVSTGFYRYEKAPQELRLMTEAQMETRMYHAVNEGIGNSKIRAGIIKLAAEQSTLTDWEKKAFRAAARVQKATGVPIGCHTCTGAREQLDILMQNGANPNHINFAHVETEPSWEGRTIDQTAERLLSVAKDGGYLLFNNFFQEFFTPWKDMVYLLRYFCDKGYSNRIFTSMDTNWEWKDGKQVFEQEDGKDPTGARKRTYAYLLTNGVPELEKAGFSKDEIDTFLVNNPRNFFSGKF